jgi:membrane-bound serine protease (ClpP class)
MTVLGWIVSLYVAGVLLILAEFFVPGAVLGILGGVAVVACGVWASYIYPDLAFLFVVADLVGVMAAILLGVFLITKTNLAHGLVLEDEFTQEKGYVSDVTDATLLGAIGEVYSPLRPVGAITVNERRVAAVADGSFVDAGVTVRVIEVQGNRVVVERVQDPPAPSV